MTKETDSGVLHHIEQLVHEEQKLYSQADLNDHGQVRLEAIKVELDQAWDLLRQRRALRDAGKDPDQAHVRPGSVVEKYEQ